MKTAKVKQQNPLMLENSSQFLSSQQPYDHDVALNIAGGERLIRSETIVCGQH